MVQSNWWLVFIMFSIIDAFSAKLYRCHFVTPYFVTGSIAAQPKIQLLYFLVHPNTDGIIYYMSSNSYFSVNFNPTNRLNNLKGDVWILLSSASSFAKKGSILEVFSFYMN